MKRVFCRDTEDRELEFEPWDGDTYKEVMVSINDGEDTAICTINDGQAANIVRFLDNHFGLNMLKEGGQVNESQGTPKTVAAIADAVTSTGCLLEVDGIPFTWEEFHRNNSGEDAILSAFDLAKVEALNVGESLYLGIQEVKRIQ